jgi:hypothetical protein
LVARTATGQDGNGAKPEKLRPHRPHSAIVADLFETEKRIVLAPGPAIASPSRIRRAPAPHIEKSTKVPIDKSMTERI